MVSFNIKPEPKELQEVDLERRKFVTALGAGLAAAAVMQTLPILLDDDQSTSKVKRPPGATNQSLIDHCVRCGACVRVCPAGVLHPATLESGVKGFWTPVRDGQCAYGCHACGDVCPTGAIPKLSEVKKNSRMRNNPSSAEH